MKFHAITAAIRDPINKMGDMKREGDRINELLLFQKKLGRKHSEQRNRVNLNQIR